LPKLTNELLKESRLTHTQVETIELSKRVKNREITVRQAGEMKTTGTARPGSYYRILDQARHNLRRTTFTLLVAARLQLISVEDLLRLLNMVRDAPEEMSDENLQQFTALIGQVVKKLVRI
jgi:hypothetical protein